MQDKVSLRNMKLSTVFGSKIAKPSLEIIITEVSENKYEIRLENGLGSLKAYMTEDHRGERYVWLDWIGSETKGGGVTLYYHFMIWFLRYHNDKYVKMDSSYASYGFHFRMGALPRKGRNRHHNFFREGLTLIKNNLDKKQRDCENTSLVMEIRQRGIEKWRKVIAE